MAKSPTAFRTISEVSEWLDTPAHVLRFWESRFSQVEPVKRAGGRRYYRPDDMLLLGGIKKLLHEDGLTIRGVQKLLREKGVRHVATLSPALDVAAPEAEAHAAGAVLPGAPLPAELMPGAEAAAEAADASPARPVEPEHGAPEHAEPEIVPESPAAAGPATSPPAPAAPTLFDLIESESAPAQASFGAASSGAGSAPAPAPLGADIAETDPADDDPIFAGAAPTPISQLLSRRAPARLAARADEAAATLAQLRALAARMDAEAAARSGQPR